MGSDASRNLWRAMVETQVIASKSFESLQKQMPARVTEALHNRVREIVDRIEQAQRAFLREAVREEKAEDLLLCCRNIEIGQRYLLEMLNGNFRGSFHVIPAQAMLLAALDEHRDQLRFVGMPTRRPSDAGKRGIWGRLSREWLESETPTSRDNMERLRVQVAARHTKRPAGGSHV